MLAYHYRRSDNKAKALEYLDLANRKAARVCAMEEAKAHFDEAMKILDALPEADVNQKWRVPMVVNQAMVFHLLFRLREYYEILARFEPEAAKAGDAWLLGAYYARLGNCEWSFGKYEQAIHTLTKAAELCESAGNPEDAGFAYVILEWSHLLSGNYEQTFAFREKVLQKGEQRFNLRWHVWALGAAARARAILGHWDEAVEEAEKALRAAEEFSDNSMIAFACWTLCMVNTWKGDLPRAIECAESGIEKASTPADKAWVQRGLAWALCRSGETTRGIELYHELLKVFRAGHFVPSEVVAACKLGEGYWLAGEPDRATRRLEEGLELAESCGMRFYMGWANRILGEITLKKDSDKAQSYFERCISILQEIKAENELALAYAGYGRVHKQQGNIELAGEYLTKALEIFERLGTLIEPDKVKQELAELPEA
jgi:tetratricopeptide (TPR) repeat protein